MLRLEFKVTVKVVFRIQGLLGFGLGLKFRIRVWVITVR